MKPLFIPLKTEYFDAFESGEKTVELRLLGKRWNFNTCREGRPVLLSRGYGKHRRLEGYISSVEVKHSTGLEPEEREAVRKCYGEDMANIIRIGIRSLKLVKAD